MNPYDSAMHVLPIVYATMGFEPKNVLDIGCSDGSWLRAAKDIAAAVHCPLQVLGLDIVSRDKVQLGANEYIMHDVRDIQYFGPSIGLNHKWDLVICLEVAEHLNPASADPLIWLLTRYSDHVLFSAATPGQGPYTPDEPNNPAGHHNEQPPTYWQGLFRLYGYSYTSLYSYLNDETTGIIQHVDPWYRSNAGLYVKVV